MDLIRIENLHFFYRSEQRVHPETKREEKPLWVLRGIDLEIRRGEWVALVGANGSGKSTLLKHLNALLIPTKGDVWVSGMNTRDSSSMQQIRKNVGMVFQVPETQIITTGVEEEVAFGPENLSVPVDELRERVERALQETGLDQLRDRSPYHLSEGQKQLLAIASVLAMNPLCMVLDEATSMLDPRSREMVLSTARRLHREGMTVVAATHSMEEAAHAQRIVVLSEGRVVLDGEPASVFSDEKQICDLKLDLPYPVRIAQRLENLLDADPSTFLTIDELFTALVATLERRA